jgi:hypothetical protein
VERGTSKPTDIDDVCFWRKQTIGCLVLADLVRQQTVNSVTVPNSYGELRQTMAPPFRPFGNLIRADKGKPVERQGRKATGLRAQA